MEEHARRFAGLVLASLLGASSWAAETRKPPVTLPPVGVELVQFDAIVTGGGKPVTDLERENFALRVDGRPVPITHFALGTAATPVQFVPGSPEPLPVVKIQSTAPQALAPRGRYIVFLVDDLLADPNHPEYLLQARRALQRFIQEKLEPGDLAAVLTTSSEPGFLQQFTADKAVLEKAIERIRPLMRLNCLSSFCGVPCDESSSFTPIGAFGLERSVNASPRGDDPCRDQILQILNAVAQSSLDSIEGIIGRLGALAGRKIVVLCADGFSVTAELRERMRLMVAAATRAGVTIYSIDTKGLEPPFARSMEDMVRAREGPANLAEETGGLEFTNSNDLSLGLARVLAENETYYVFGFEPAAPKWDGRFHSIDLKVVGRQGLKVRTRKGYYEEDAEKLKEVALRPERARLGRVGQALSSMVPLTGIPIVLRADYVQRAEGPALLLRTSIGPEGIALDDAGEARRGVVELVGYVYDEKGKPAADLGQRVELALRAAKAAEFQRSGLRFDRVVPLTPGLYQVRLVALSEGAAGPVGSASAWLEIPDLAKHELVVTGPLLMGASSSEGEPKLVPASQRFVRGASLLFQVQAYNLKPDAGGSVDAVARARLISGAQEELALSFEGEPAEGGGMRFVGQLDLSALAAGAHDLEVTVEDRVAQKTVQKSTSFVVE